MADAKLASTDEKNVLNLLAIIVLLVSIWPRIWKCCKNPLFLRWRFSLIVKLVFFMSSLHFSNVRDNNVVLPILYFV